LKTTIGDHGAGRYYIVDEDKNIKYPSVTTILSEMSDKSGLEAWKARVGEAEAEKISKFSANRGTFMHSLHEQYINSRFLESEDYPLKTAFERSLQECSKLTNEEKEVGKNLFLNFYNHTDFYERIDEVLFQEEPLWSSKGGGYAGRMDLAIRSKDGKNKIIDFKTSKKPKKEEWIDGYKMQTAAYSIALFERTGILPQSCEIWISCETGEVQLFEMDLESIKTYFVKFHEKVVEYHEKFHKTS
jgi:CRISPR/Cas system-associated exonuclease Cas4 (RecB family)